MTEAASTMRSWLQTHRKYLASLGAGLFLSLAPLTPALAWWDEGHMQIAYLAYNHLDPVVKERVDVLLKRNTDYASWICGAPNSDATKLYAFVHAATWADDIKGDAAFANDKVTDPQAGQLDGYAGKKQHRFWHYKDTQFSPDGTPLPPPDPVDAVSQTKLMIAALPSSSGASDDIRSFSLVWLLHLVGDLHQPLHAAGRFTAAIPDGDQGGNAEKVIPATGETIALHAYWDRLFGGYSSVAGAIFDADKKNGGIEGITADPAAAKIIDPDAWEQESFDLAKTFAYAPPTSNDKTPVLLTRDYETNARNTARNQATLAGARLATLLNILLK